MQIPNFRLRDEFSVRGSNDKLNYEKLSGQEENFKLEYDAIKAKLRDLTCELEEKCKHFHETESSLKTEVKFGHEIFLPTFIYL